MKTNSDRDKTISRRFLLLGGIVLILAVLILLTSRNDDNRIFNVETVYDTVFVATDSSINSQPSTAKVIAHHRTSIPKNPWRGNSVSHSNKPERHPLKPNHENSKAFAKSISTLFSPYYYTPLTTDDSIDLLYETCRNDSTYTFGVLCRWFSSCPDDGVEWCSPDSLAQYGTLSQYPVFLVLGIGGSPDAPEDLYVLRAWTLRNSISPNFLSKAHRKTPGKKFFYKHDGPWLN